MGRPNTHPHASAAPGALGVRWVPHQGAVLLDGSLVLICTSTRVTPPGNKLQHVTGTCSALCSCFYHYTVIYYTKIVLKTLAQVADPFGFSIFSPE